MDKKRNKFLRQKLGWILIKVFVFVCGIISLSWNYFLGKILGSIAYLAMVRHRQIAMEGLATAFPEMGIKQRKKIARDSFIFMAQGFFELFYFFKNPDQLQNIRIDGEANLKQAINEGKGAVMVTAHLGNFPLMSLKLAKVGYPVNIVVRPMRDEKIDDYIHSLRTAAGIKTIFSFPRRECVNGIIRALANNEVVVMLMDQNFGTGGVWVKFFGKLAATPVGPVVLALRAQSPVVTAYIYREGRAKHCIKIFSEEVLTITPDKNETVLINAIKLTRIIEGWIKKEVSQWSWIHRRWKSRPPKEIDKLSFKIEQ